jgi:hypothetical protein
LKNFGLSRTSATHSKKDSFTRNPPLNHQVVSVTTDPIFVSDLILALELSATIQTPEARSEDKHVGPRATIALDSGSSIHIFKDAFLLLTD